jgi:hypothetical protein
MYFAGDGPLYQDISTPGKDAARLDNQLKSFELKWSE